MFRPLGLATVVALFVSLSPMSRTLAKTTVDFWEVWGRTADIKAALAGFEASNPDIEVNVTTAPQGQAQRDKLFTAIAAGAPPDIVLMVSPIAEIAMQGVLTPLDSLLAKSRSIRRQDYPPGLLDMFKVGGATYGIPAVEVGPWLGLAYNSDLFAAAGLKPNAPGTLEELLQAHKKLTRLTDGKLDQLGLDPLDAMGGTYFANIWPAVFDQVLYDAETRTLAIDTPGMRAIFDYVKSFYERPTYSQVGEFHSKYGSWSGSMASGRQVMQINGYWTAGELRQLKTRDQFAFGWVPNTRRDRLMVVGGWGMVIPKGARDVEEAFRVMEYMTGASAARAIFNGPGWLNGNLAAMRSIDTRSNPGITFFMQALSESDRVQVPENIPLTLDVRAALQKAMREVAAGQVATSQVLPDVQRQLQAKLDAVFR